MYGDTGLRRVTHLLLTTGIFLCSLRRTPTRPIAACTVRRTLPSHTKRGCIFQQSATAGKINENSQSLLEWNRFGVTPAVTMIWGCKIPPMEKVKLLLFENPLAGASEKASKKMNRLGRKMYTKVLNLFLRIFLSHNDSVVIIIRLDHLYTLALAAECIEGALRMVSESATAVVEEADPFVSDWASGSRLRLDRACSRIMKE